MRGTENGTVQSMTGMTRSGRCHCGEVTLHVNGLLRPPINCHCGLCRRLSGAAFTTWLSVPADDFVLQGEEQLCCYSPTPHLQRFFCRHCGTHVLTRDARCSHIVGLPAGVMADADVPPPSGEYFVSHKASWHTLPAAAACFGGDTGFEPIPGPAGGHGA